MGRVVGGMLQQGAKGIPVMNIIKPIVNDGATTSKITSKD